MASLLKIVCVFLAICMVLGPTELVAETAISCTGVQDTLTPCIAYLTSVGGATTPPTECCAGLRSVKTMARTTDERRVVCQCVKGAAANTRGLNYDLAAKLPAQCGVSLSYTFSPNTDCTTI